MNISHPVTADRFRGLTSISFVDSTDTEIHSIDQFTDDTLEFSVENKGWEDEVDSLELDAGTYAYLITASSKIPGFHLDNFGNIVDDATVAKVIVSFAEKGKSLTVDASPSTTMSGDKESSTLTMKWMLSKSDFSSKVTWA